MKRENNLELVPVLCVQKAIVDDLYIPMAFRKSSSKNNSPAKEKTNPSVKTSKKTIENKISYDVLLE